MTDIAVHTYWNVGEWGWQQEVADAYNYFTGDTLQRERISAGDMATAFNPFALNTIATTFYYGRLGPLGQPVVQGMARLAEYPGFSRTKAVMASVGGCRRYDGNDRCDAKPVPA